MKIKQIRPQEDKFTEVLATIALMPKMLYFDGKMPDCEGFRPKCVAIVGARKCTKYGEEVAYRLAYDLARRGVVVISGLAYGCDSVAHRGALDGGGATIGVLGTAIGKIYPASHRGLAEEMVAKGGAIMSEYGPREEPKEGPRVSFLMRNRIVAGLADAVVVVEAGVKSGSLNTAMHALEQGRELFAVPGDVTRPMSVGTNGLIRTGAHVCTSADDVMGVICPKEMKQMKFEVLGENELENNIMGCIKTGIRDGEKIVAELGVSAGEFNGAVTMMEIRGAVRPLGGNMWTLG